MANVAQVSEHSSLEAGSASVVCLESGGAGAVVDILPVDEIHFAWRASPVFFHLPGGGNSSKAAIEKEFFERGVAAGNSHHAHRVGERIVVELAHIWF